VGWMGDGLRGWWGCESCNGGEIITGRIVRVRVSLLALFASNG
jgi:hypothetical protein